MTDENGNNGKELTKYQITELFVLTKDSNKKIDELKIQVTEIGVKIQSCQSEITEHKSDHKWNLGMTTTIATFFSGVIAWVINHFRGAK